MAGPCEARGRRLTAAWPGAPAHGRYPARIARASRSNERAPARGRARHSRPRGGAGAARGWLIALGAVAVALAAALVALAVSRYHGHAAAPPPTTAAPPATTPSGPPCPLTGQPTASGVPQRPALAVKVDNYPDARPQSGLDKADIVFEEPVEGGITRLVAVFQCSQASLVGPIRSAR